MIMDHRRRSAELLFKAEEALQQSNENVYFPGWPPKSDIAEYETIKEMARAILAEGVAEDRGTYVQANSLATLLNYVGSMIDPEA